MRKRRGLFHLLTGIIIMGNGIPTLGFSMGRSLLDKLIFYPTTEKIEPTLAERKVLPSGLEIWIHRRPATLPTSSRHKVYLVHFIGNASRAEVEGPDQILLGLFPPEFNVESWAVNYRGFGGSTGVPRLANLPETGLEAFDAVSQEAGSSPVFISGFSLGTSVALYLAIHRNAAGLILRNPIPIRELILGKFGWWNLWLAAGPISMKVPKELDSVKNAANAKLPAVILSSEKDTIIPKEYQDKVTENYAGPMDSILLKNSEHGDPIPRSAFEPIKRSLKKMLVNLRDRL
jgi:predicted esterase